MRQRGGKGEGFVSPGIKAARRRGQCARVDDQTCHFS